MKVYDFIEAFSNCGNFSLNLRDENDVVWFFGEVKDSKERIPKWCMKKKIFWFKITNFSPNSYLIMANFKN